MESITFFISVLLLLASLYYFFRKVIPISSRQPKLAAGYQQPPGSQGWPIIGETLDYIRTSRNGVPEKFIQDRRNKYSDDDVSCKVFRTSLLGEPMAVLCTAAGNKFLFSNENKLVKSWWPDIAQKLFVDATKVDPSKTSMHNRKAIFPFLKPDAVRKHIGLMDQITVEHLGKHWSFNDQKQAIKFHPLIKRYALVLSSRMFLNLEDPDGIARLEDYINVMNKGLVSLPVDLPGTNFNRAIKASVKLKKEIGRMVAQRKLHLNDDEQLVNGPSDLMASLLLDGVQMTEEEITMSMCSVMLAGSDTITSALCSTIMALSQFPQVYHAVLQEQLAIVELKNEGELLNWEDVQNMKYTWNVVCEVLRLQPPISGTFREALSDFFYEGFLIPKGMKLHWNVHATHKNPEYFSDPHKFDQSRFEGHGPPPYSYVPFGGGPRMCPGKEHARYEILIFLHNLVIRYKWKMSYPDEKMIVETVPTPSKGLLVHVSPRI